jgi:predicted dienelactone hydrolase
MGANGAVAAVIQGRLLDEQFVLDELERLNASDPQLGGRLDLDEIGAFGYSAGGMTALELCFHDPRCKAGAGLDSGSDDSN